MKQIFTIVIAALMLSGAVSAQSTTTRELTNLVIFIRFADDDEITHPLADIDSMFNGRTPGYYSVYNYYDAMSYGRIHYNTVYTNNIQNGTIVSYRDTMPRGYFQPYTATNLIGYRGQNPFIGISMREAQLQARAFRYVDSLGLVSPDVVLDGDGDGDIDNVSFIVKGGIGEWASILWPHMEYFPHDDSLTAQQQQEQSYIGRIGKTIEPVFKPQGFNWKLDVSLVAGIGAKEIVASTIGVLYSGDDSFADDDAFSEDSQKYVSLRQAMIADGINPLAGYCYLLFVLLYFPCIATIVAIKNETNSWRWACFAATYTTVLAWLVSALVYQAASLFIS